MNAKWRPVHAWSAIVALHAAQTVYYYPRVPSIVAQHFGADGQPNGWAPKDVFFIFSGVILLGVSALLMLTPRLLRRVPVSLINLPNKQHWLAPARKEESLAFVEWQLEWMAVLTAAFLVLVMHLAIRANLDPGHRLNNAAFITLLALFVLSAVYWVVKLYRRFPAEASSDAESSAGMRK